MQTRIDSSIEKFVHSYVEKGFVSSESIQALLDAARVEYGIDRVDIVETMPGRNSFFFTYDSTSDGTNHVGASATISNSQFETLINIYGEDGLCDFVVDGFQGLVEEGSVLHFGFFSARDFYGMVGFQTSARRLWTREERNALIKIGRALTPHIIEKQARIRMRKYSKYEEQFKQAIMSDNLFCFTADLSRDIIDEDINFEDFGSRISLLDLVQLSPPCSFAEVVNRLKPKLLEEDKNALDDVDSCDKLIEAYKSGKSNITIEFGISFSGAGVKYIRENIIITKDEVYGTLSAICMSKDITAMRLRDREDKRALKEALDAASSANAAKTDFLSRMSHDIRTPMNIIIGMTTILSSGLDDKQKVKDGLEKIMVASKHLLGIINNILDMSKIEAGKMIISENEFTIESVVDELEEIAKALCMEKNHELSIHVDNIRHSNVIGDNQKLMQVFVNIISNAVKYTPDGGHISIRLFEEEGKNQNIGRYRFEVTDDGVGMSKEFLEKLFNPFERAEDIRISKNQGTGLGMAIAKSIVQMMGGNIQVESELGKGTKFSITIFLKLSETKESYVSNEFLSPKEITSDYSHDYSSKRLLVVEDNELNREIAVELLGAIGFVAESAEDGMQAIEKFSASNVGYYDAILMDIQMPVMNGYEACEHIRRLTRSDAATIPIIAMTANAFSEDVASAMKAGMNAHVAKPLDLKLLISELDRLLF